jgi:hypothetical protein
VHLEKEKNSSFTGPLAMTEEDYLRIEKSIKDEIVKFNADKKEKVVSKSS